MLSGEVPSSAGEGSGRKIAPRLLEVIGEQADGVVSDALCLRWLTDLAEGRRRWRGLENLSNDNRIAVQARLKLLLDLWGHSNMD